MITIHNARIVNLGREYTGYVAIDGEFIHAMGDGAAPEALLAASQEVIDAAGMLLIPGCIDDHVHFREPGLTHKADIASESRAAVAGGVTSYMDMPNTKPLTITAEALEEKFDIAARSSVANYSFFIGATNDNIDTLLSIDNKRVAGVKLFLGSSTGNMLVDESDVLHRLFRECRTLISVHSEDEAIIRERRAFYTGRFGEDLSVFYHPLIRSAEACYVCTERAVELARRYGTRLHVAHISTARELELFWAEPLLDKRITAEACVHHLWFTDNDYASLGTRIKCNPAIKTTADRNALRDAVNNGAIDLIATDHAPHLLSEKQGGALTAASGSPYVQFSLIMMLELVRQGVFSTVTVVEKMCHAPAMLYNIDRRGILRPGYYADIVLIDTNTRHTVTKEDVLSKCGWSPLEGTTFHSRVVKTFVNGKCIYSDGVVADNLASHPLKFNR
ncbi:MAG: dihydroorotase [Bacteroidales bacterium]|nr:dihydroorotase [Bacteroidales bacterium]MDY4882599.1 dihydroorotase [Muribaculaceae bacterium]MDY5120090.1 dihydroorotase [Muribaculaceae bacterium]